MGMLLVTSEFRKARAHNKRLFAVELAVRQLENMAFAYGTINYHHPIIEGQLRETGFCHYLFL